jgi:hypothetical protein
MGHAKPRKVAWTKAIKQGRDGIGSKIVVLSRNPNKDSGRMKDFGDSFRSLWDPSAFLEAFRD